MKTFKNNQSEYAQYWNENHLQIQSNTLKSDEFTIIVNSNDLQNLQYLVLLLQSIKKCNPYFNYDVHLKHAILDDFEEAKRVKDADWSKIYNYLCCLKDEFF